MRFCSLEEAFSNKWESKEYPAIEKDNRFTLADPGNCSSYIDHVSNCKQCMEAIVMKNTVFTQKPVYIKENFSMETCSNKDRETMIIIMAVIAFTWFLSNRLK